MTDFDIWTWNSRAFPDIDPLMVAKVDRVRIRMGSLSGTNHPIHMRGYGSEVTGKDGGCVWGSAHGPEASIDLLVGAMRAIESRLHIKGTGRLHCHKSHHTMNVLGHSVRTYIGVDQREIAKKVG